MKIEYTYKFSNENLTIEIDDSDYELLIAFDREEYNNDRKHGRHNPVSLDDADFEGDWFTDGTDILGDLIHKSERELVHAAVDRLKSNQRDLINAIYFENISVNDYAARKGVDHSAISHRLKVAYNNLIKFLE